MRIYGQPTDTSFPGQHLVHVGHVIVLDAVLNLRHTRELIFQHSLHVLLHEV